MRPPMNRTNESTQKRRTFLDQSIWRVHALPSLEPHPDNVIRALAAFAAAGVIVVNETETMLLNLAVARNKLSLCKAP